MVNHATGILSTPIRSEFIQTLDDAIAYYRYKFVRRSPHQVVVNGITVPIYFYEAETHPYSTERPCDRCAGSVCLVVKDHQRHRCFDRARARRMDDILSTVTSFSKAIDAGGKNAIQLIGPRQPNTQKMAVILMYDTSRVAWFVRTAYPLSAADHSKRSRAAAKKWP